MSPAQARTIISNTNQDVFGYKINHSLLQEDFLLSVHSLYIIADLKLFDIPDTMINICRWLHKFQVNAVTVHLRMETSAFKKLKNNIEIDIIGITVLTSERSNKPLDDHIDKARHNSILGTVCPGNKATTTMIPSFNNNTLKQFCPGIRMEDDETHDHNQYTTPKQALENGADFLIIGRPITEASDPQKALDEIAVTLYED